MPDLNRFFGDLATGVGEQGKLLKILWEKLNTPTVDFPGEDDFVSNLGEDASTPLSLLLGAGGLYGGAKMAGRAFDRMVNAPVDPRRRGFLKATGAGAGGAAASMMSTGKRAIPELDDIDKLKELLRARHTEQRAMDDFYNQNFREIEQFSDYKSRIRPEPTNAQLAEYNKMEDSIRSRGDEIANSWEDMLERHGSVNIGDQQIPRNLAESGRRREVFRGMTDDPIELEADFLDMNSPAYNTWKYDSHATPNTLKNQYKDEFNKGYLFNEDGSIRRILKEGRGLRSDDPRRMATPFSYDDYDRVARQNSWSQTLAAPIPKRAVPIREVQDTRLQSEKWVDAIKRRWLGAGP